MDLLDMQDILHVDRDELGVRRMTLIDDYNDIDFDENLIDYFGKGKQLEFPAMGSCEKSTTDEENISLSDEDDSNYDIDPETGEKTFRISLAASSPSFSTANDNNWVTEYLSSIGSLLPSSLAKQPISSREVPNSDFLFEDISLSNDQTRLNPYSLCITTDESANSIMFHDKFLSGQINDERNQNLPQTISSVFVASSNKNAQDCGMNFASVASDDDHTLNSVGNSYQRRRFYSSIESDSNTLDSEVTFDGSFVETKLEKVEYDDPAHMQSILHRASSRGSPQVQPDEDIISRYNIPLTLHDITHSTTEEYNRHLAHLSHLSPEQIHIIKDIRRRGKNKIAAQNCRKRKAVNVETLLEEVKRLKQLKRELEEHKKLYQQQIAETRTQYEYLHRQILPDRQLPPAIIVK